MVLFSIPVSLENEILSIAILSSWAKKIFNYTACGCVVKGKQIEFLLTYYLPER